MLSCFRDEVDATALHFIGSPDQKKGTDLIPELHDEFPSSSPYTTLDVFGHEKYVSSDNCLKIQSLSKRNYFEQTVGPFKSYGGYDWFYIYWYKAFKNIPSKVSVYSSFTGIVDASGHRVPYPPIHPHHALGLPNRGLQPPRLDIFKHCLNTKICTNSIALPIVASGQVNDAEGKSYDVVLPGVFEISESISYGGWFNDVRPENASPLTWFFKVSISTTDEQRPKL
jgi:hypothetical protein